MIQQLTRDSRWSEAVAYTYEVRWRGNKDGERSMGRALSVLEGLPPAERSLPVHELLTPYRAHQLRDRLKAAGKSPGTVNRALAAFSAVWRECHKLGAVDRGPVEGLYLKEPKGRNRVVTPREVEQVRALLPADLADLVTFLYETGCRVSEALKLEAVDVDPERQLVTFSGTKNGEDRTVPLTAAAWHALWKRPARMFTGVGQGFLNREWNRARESMGLSSDPGFVPHALRHSAITRWVVAGIPLPVVAQMAGHRALKTTMRYTHVTAADAARALEAAGLR